VALHRKRCFDLTFRIALPFARVMIPCFGSSYYEYDWYYSYHEAVWGG
jgi:hypothetical protein